MSTVVKDLVKPGQNSVLLKGAPERVIEKCASYKKGDGSITNFTADDKKKLTNQV
jgi:magnesium-transporting ATPase (P-type)